MRYPTDDTSLLIATLTDMLEGVPEAEAHAVFLVETLVQLKGAFKRGLITEIIASGMRPRTMIIAVDPSEVLFNSREAGHA